MSTHTPDHEPDLPQQGDGAHGANPQPDIETPAGHASPVAPAAHCLLYTSPSPRDS